jgi:LysM repeat protein
MILMINSSAKKTFLIGILSVSALLTGSCGRQEEVDQRGELSALAGKMAAEKDLREVRVEDLDGNGNREVILVFGPRELLNFDVYYQPDNGGWVLTPPVNDQNNPREFISTMLDSIHKGAGDSIPLIEVSSKLYDGNTMVKELHWSPTGFKIVSQRTVMAGARARKAEEAVSSSAGSPEGKAPSQSVVQAGPESGSKPQPKPAEKPKPRKVTPLTPSSGTYLVKKGDTVFSLANTLGVSVGDLESLNGNQLQKRGLRISQKINVPVPSARKSNVKVSIEKERYTVKPGESLTAIANHFGVTIQALKSWNPSIPEDGTVRSGQTLNIHRAVLDIRP